MQEVKFIFTLCFIFLSDQGICIIHLMLGQRTISIVSPEEHLISNVTPMRGLILLENDIML